ncbi:MAG: glycosyl hydrolase [Candidatus Cryptobacteroides sp.]
MKKHILYIFSALLCLAASCQGTDDPAEDPVEAPKLVSSIPANGEKDVDYMSLTAKLTFDVNIMCPTAKRGEITISPSGSITSVDAYGKDVSIVLGDLQPATDYTLRLPEGTVKGYNDNVAKGLSISFRTRDKAESAISADLVTANPSTNAKKVYDYFRSVYGVKTISGAIAKVNWNTTEADWVNKWTGKYPAMATFDYIHLFASPANWIDYSDITPARSWFEKGGIVSACWHWNVPLSEGSSDYTCTPGNGTEGTTFRPSNIFKEGTWEKRTADADLAKITKYLKLLQDAGIPVVWRPLHEAAGNTYTYKTGAWFWWGADGPETYVRLWKYVFDYFKSAGLNNLIWVWTSQTSSQADIDSPFYPGDDYVDIIGRDIYNVSSAAQVADNFKLLQELYPNKMVTLSEHGGVPSIADQWASGGRWLYFMPWYDYDNDLSEGYKHQYADIAWWNASWACKDVVSLDELPDNLYK